MLYLGRVILPRNNRLLPELVQRLSYQARPRAHVSQYGCWSGPLTSHFDNMAAIHIASNLIYRNHTKHVEVDCHIIHEKVAKEVKLEVRSVWRFPYVRCFNEALFINIFSKLGIVDIHAPAWGGSIVIHEGTNVISVKTRTFPIWQNLSIFFYKYKFLVIQIWRAGFPYTVKQSTLSLPRVIFSSLSYSSHILRFSFGSAFLITLLFFSHSPFFFRFISTFLFLYYCSIIRITMVAKLLLSPPFPLLGYMA